MPIDFQTLMYIALAILFLVFSGARRRKAAERTPPPNTEANEAVPTDMDIDVHSERDMVLPPFMQNLEGLDPNMDSLEETIADEISELPMDTEQVVPDTQPEPETKQIEPPPVPVDSPINLPTKSLPFTSLIEPSPDTFRQGIILSEILGKPKGLRDRK